MVDVTTNFIIDKFRDFISVGKHATNFVLVLPYPPFQVIGHTCIEHRVAFVVIM